MFSEQSVQFLKDLLEVFKGCFQFLWHICTTPLFDILFAIAICIFILGIIIDRRRAKKNAHAKARYDIEVQKQAYREIEEEKRNRKY